MCYQYTLEKTQGTIKNVQSRDIGNTGHTRHMTKTNKRKQIQTTLHRNRNDEQHELHQKNSGAREE